MWSLIILNMDELSSNRSCSCTDILQKLNTGTNKKYWMNFPEMSPAHTQQIVISKKYWMSFPEIRLCHTPEN